MKKGIKFCLGLALTVAAGGALWAYSSWDYKKDHITVDYTKEYSKDLDRLLGEGWTVLGTEKGYTTTPRQLIYIDTWEIGFRDESGSDRTLILTNSKDRSKNGFGYCIEHNFLEAAAAKYTEEVINPVIPAVCRDMDSWLKSVNYHVEGDHITDQDSVWTEPEGNPWAEVRLKSHLLTGSSYLYSDWENPESGKTLYHIDYPSVFAEDEALRYLQINVKLRTDDFSEAECAEKKKAMEEQVERLLEELNRYTGNTLNADIISTCVNGGDWDEREYRHLYVINGRLTETVEYTAEEEMERYRSVDPMWLKLEASRL